MCRNGGHNSPLVQGLLTGRYARVEDVPEYLARTRLYAGHRPFAKHNEAGCEEAIFAATPRIRQVAEEVGHSMAVVSLTWVKQQPGVTSVLVGAHNPQELEWNLPAADATLPPAIQQKLAAITEPVKARRGQHPDPWMSESRVR